MPEIYGSKTGENITALLSGVLERYNITYKIGFLISDNASLNDRAINLLVIQYGWDAKEHRIRCSSYILNLIAKAIVFGNRLSLFKRSLVSISEEDQYVE